MDVKRRLEKGGIHPAGVFKIYGVVKTAVAEAADFVVIEKVNEHCAHRGQNHTVMGKPLAFHSLVSGDYEKNGKKNRKGYA